LTLPRQFDVNAGVGDIETAVPDVFGEFLQKFRSSLSDVERVLIAAAFAQERDPSRVFTRKMVNQLLLDQNFKVSNPSERIRRLIGTKRAFSVGNGSFRISANGFEHLKTLMSES